MNQKKIKKYNILLKILLLIITIIFMSNVLHAEIIMHKKEYILGEKIELITKDITGFFYLKIFDITNNIGGNTLPSPKIYEYKSYIDEQEVISIPLKRIGIYQIVCDWNGNHKELFIKILGPKIEFEYQNNVKINYKIIANLVINNNEDINLSNIKLEVFSEAVEFEKNEFYFNITPFEKKEFFLKGKAKESGSIILSFNLGKYGSFSKNYDLYVLQEANVQCKIENLPLSVKVGEEFYFNYIISNSGDFDLENITINISQNEVLDFDKKSFFLQTLKKHSLESFIIHCIPQENRNTVVNILCSNKNRTLCETYRSISVYSNDIPLKLSLIEKEYSDSILYLTVHIECNKAEEIRIGYFYNYNIMELINYPRKNFKILPDQNNYNLELQFKLKTVQLSEEDDAIGVRATYLEEPSITDYLLIKYLLKKNE